MLVGVISCYHPSEIASSLYKISRLRVGYSLYIEINLSEHSADFIKENMTKKRLYIRLRAKLYEF